MFYPICDARGNLNVLNEFAFFLRNSQNLDVVENRRQSDGEEVVPEEAKSCSALPSANEEPEQSTSSGREGPWASQQSTLVVSLDNRRSVEFPTSSPTGDLVRLLQ